MSMFAFALLLFGALAGSFVSGLAGFGTALMALGIWLYVLPPSTVVPLVVICSIIAQTTTCRRFGVHRLQPGLALSAGRSRRRAARDHAGR
jgi:uncharacterized membrane protein YfcA